MVRKKICFSAGSFAKITKNRGASVSTTSLYGLIYVDIRAVIETRTSGTRRQGSEESDDDDDSHSDIYKQQIPSKTQAARRH